MHELATPKALGPHLPTLLQESWDSASMGISMSISTLNEESWDLVGMGISMSISTLIGVIINHKVELPQQLKPQSLSPMLLQVKLNPPLGNRGLRDPFRGDL